MFYTNTAEGQIEAAIKKAIKRSTVWLGQLAAGVIGFTAFKTMIYRQMRELYTETAAIAVNGPLTSAEKVFVESSIQEQLFAEVGDNSFGLSARMAQYQANALTMGQFSLTISNYIKSSRGHAIEMWSKREGDRLVVRKLGATDDHCPQCLLYASLPAMKLKDAVIPSRNCDCYVNCRCILVEVSR